LECGVILRVEIEPADRRTIKRADRDDRLSNDVLAGCNGLDGIECLLTGIGTAAKSRVPSLSLNILISSK
jgi:hypothetical protein